MTFQSRSTPTIHPAALVKRGDRLRTADHTVLDSFDDDRVTDPARDLAYLSFTERELASVRVNSHRFGTATGDIASAEEYSDYNIVRTWSSQLQAKQSLRTARYYHERACSAVKDTWVRWSSVTDSSVSTIDHDINY